MHYALHRHEGKEGHETRAHVLRSVPCHGIHENMRLQTKIGGGLMS